jgi:hypothetical protein
MFEEWLNDVRTAVLAITDGAFSMDDLADWPSWDTWDSGATPHDGAMCCLENDDIGCAFLELLDDAGEI